FTATTREWLQLVKQGGASGDLSAARMRSPFGRPIPASSLNLPNEEDSDVRDIEMLAIPGRLATIAVCRVRLHAGAHPELTRDRVLTALRKLWYEVPIVAITSTKGQVGNDVVTLPNLGDMTTLFLARAQRMALAKLLLGSDDLLGRALARTDASGRA